MRKRGPLHHGLVGSGFTDLPGSWMQQMVNMLSTDSKIALRASCKAMQQMVDTAGVVCLKLRNRTPALGTVHHLGLLVHISMLDSSTASRGALSIKMDPKLVAGCMPRLRSAVMTNSQASLAKLLASAAPQLSSMELTVSSSTPTVMRELAGLPQLRSLVLNLSHPAWMRGCGGLGELTQLQQLTVSGQPLDEASKHGGGAITCPFWEDNVAVLTQLTSLSVNPWIKAVPGSTAVTYSSLKQLRQLSVPYCSGKAGPNATAGMLQQLGQHCSQLTSLTFGVHEFNWSVSQLAGLTQLRECELHNPFLKEMWGLQPFTAAHLAPLTAATQLTALTISTLRLPLLADIMTAAGQPTAAMAAAAAVLGGHHQHQQPGVVAAAAAAAALAGGGPGLELVNAIAVGAVAAAMQAAAAAAGPEAAAAVADIAATMQQHAAAAAQQAAAQLPGHAPAAAAGNAQQPADVVAAAHDMLQAVAAHAADAAHAAGVQAAAAAVAAGVMEPEQAAAAQQAAHALAAAVAPAAAAAAAAGVVLPGGIAAQLVGQHPPQAVAHIVGQGNPLAAVVAGVGAGPALGFVPVPVVPPPPPPPPAPLAPPPAAAGPPAGVAAAAAAGAGQVQQQGHASIAAAVSAAAAAAAGALLPQLPCLPSLRRLTVGTTHGRFMSGVSLAALAPNLTCFEDLSEIMHLPPVSVDVLGGLSQLQLLTVNVDTLQLHARHASLTGLSSMAMGGSSSGAGGSSGGGGGRVRRQGSAAATAAAAAAGPASRPPLQQQQQPASTVRGGGSCEGRAVSPLALNPSWRVLSNLRCLRLLMLGHIHQELLSGGGHILPRLPGVTRLELCSAFGGRMEYAETYTIAEDPLLWQEQSGVEELVVDGGVLLGGFLVDGGMARLLKRKLKRLRRLVLCRCPDLTDGHVEGAAKARLAPEIVVKRDCPLVTEAGIVAMNAKYGGVSVELVGVVAGEYEGKSFTYALDE